MTFELYVLLSPTQIPELIELSVTWQDHWRDDIFVKSSLMAEEKLHGKLEVTLETPDDLYPLLVTPINQESNWQLQRTITMDKTSIIPAYVTRPSTLLPVNGDTECILLSSDNEYNMRNECLRVTDKWLVDKKKLDNNEKSYEKNLLTEVTPVVTLASKSAPKQSLRRKRDSKETNGEVLKGLTPQKKKSHKNLFNDEDNMQIDITTSSNNTIPSGRWGHAMVKVNSGQMLLIGGQGGKHTLSRDSMWMLKKELDNLTWTELQIKIGTHKPQYRMGHTLTYDPKDECVYVYGGSKNMRWYSDIHAVDLKTWKWSLVKANGKAPTRAYHTSSLYRNELFVFGGVFPKSRQNPDECSNQLLIFTPESQNWYEPIVNGKKPAPRSGHSATVIRDQMIIFAGWDMPLCFNDLFILDLSLMEFSKVETSGTAPSPRAWHASCRLPDDRVLIHGGYNGKETLRDAFIFSLRERTWEQVELPIPDTPKAGHTLICLQNFTGEVANKENISEKADVIMFGGGDNDGIFYNDVFTFQI